MELFLPSILISILAILVVILLIPKFSPLIIVVLAAILLYVATTQHLNMFWDEYKQSTWQQNLKLFAPGIMIGAVVIFVLYGILSFFSTGVVPIPSMPSMEMPNASTATNPVTAAINTVMNTVNDVATTAANAVSNLTNNNNTVKRNNQNNNGTRKMNNNNSGPSRSYLATA
jgi:predicted membrane protein